MPRIFHSMILLVVALACLTPSTDAVARDIFVDNVAGDDARLGIRGRTSVEFSGPVRTIGRALQLARSGDQIILANNGVPYRESISLVGGDHSGYPDAPFVLDGNDCILEGSAPVPPELWENYRGPVFRFRPQRLAFQQLFLAGWPLKFRAPADREGSPPSLAPLEWSLAEGYAYFRIEADKMIEDYDLSAPADAVGITLYEVHDVLIRNLTVQGFSLDGVSAFDGVRDCTLIDVTSRGNGRSGVYVGNASRLRIIGALLGDNLYAQLFTEGLTLTRVESSDLLPLTAPAIVRRGGEVLVDGERFRGN